MPVDPSAVGARSDPKRHTWTSKDCLLYALGVGAGSADPLDELALTTENTEGVTQQVLPTMAVVLRPRSSSPLPIGTFDPAKLVHAEQRVTWHRLIPVAGELESTTEVVGVHDKGNGALVITQTEARLVDDGVAGEALFTSVSSAYIRDEGGWGGDRGPSGTVAFPERPPDHELDEPTRPDQALLYRLSGDRNPLHSDPSFAARGGFDRPILHGLCTYGVAGRALLHAACGSDPARMRSLAGRFSSSVLPGDTLRLQAWRTDPGVVLFRALVEDRVVIDHGRLEFTP